MSSDQLLRWYETVSVLLHHEIYSIYNKVTIAIEDF